MKKLFVIFGIILLLATGCNNSSKLNTEDTKIKNESIEEQVIESNQEETITEPDIKEDIKKEEIPKQGSNNQTAINPEQPKVPDSKKETVTQKQETVSKNDINSKNEETKELTIWEELGMTQEEYENTPMGAWRTVTHKTKNECVIDGDKLIDDETNNYVLYWCYEVISYSGKTLGYMLSPEE